jgi:hypothetical protein
MNSLSKQLFSRIQNNKMAAVQNFSLDSSLMAIITETPVPGM